MDRHVVKFKITGNKQSLEEVDKIFKCQFCETGFWDGTKLRHNEGRRIGNVKLVGWDIAQSSI